MVARRLLTLALAGAPLVACAPRAVLGSSATARPTVTADAAATLAGPGGGAAATVSVSAADVALGDGAPATGVVISRLPAPHRRPPMLAPLPTTPAAARTLIGHRDPRPELAFALELAAALGGAAADAAADAPGDGVALVTWAQARGAWAPATALAGALAPGDVVVFDRALGAAPASLVAVVLTTDGRGVTELVYLASGVVRRGYLDAARPKLARDREGRVVNSYLRHGRDYPPPGTRYLAGELVSGRVRLR